LTSSHWKILHRHHHCHNPIFDNYYFILFIKNDNKNKMMMKQNEKNDDKKNKNEMNEEKSNLG
jgi:hypothetical protein